MTISLETGLEQLGIQASAGQLAAWNSYLDLLVKWNQAYNLTAVRDREQMVVRHLLDSLSVARHITSTRLLDIGAGPGLPSIPLAILWPDRTIVALDSNGKKVRFMQQAKALLCLDNFTAVQARVESWAPGDSFDGITARAFARLDEIISMSGHLLSSQGTIWAMKGKVDPDELSALPKPYMVSACLPLQVPGDDAERHLVVIRRAD